MEIAKVRTEINEERLPTTHKVEKISLLHLNKWHHSSPIDKTRNTGVLKMHFSQQYPVRKSFFVTVGNQELLCVTTLKGS